MKESTRNPYLLGLVVVLVFVLGFALVTLLLSGGGGVSSPGTVTGVEVDVDVHHPRVKHSPQAAPRSPAPRKQAPVAKAPAPKK